MQGETNRFSITISDCNISKHEVFSRFTLDQKVAVLKLEVARLIRR